MVLSCLNWLKVAVVWTSTPSPHRASFSLLTPCSTFLLSFVPRLSLARFLSTLSLVQTLYVPTCLRLLRSLVWCLVVLECGTLSSSPPLFSTLLHSSLLFFLSCLFVLLSSCPLPCRGGCCDAGAMERVYVGAPSYHCLGPGRYK